ncbi:cyclic-di-GMP-binding protein [Methylocaldum szegediense]|uniref:Cyclic-di-GMP-binding protein n=2 Tax=Methylocaldum szegediense TaxID=73780 RepID=A0ABM9I591_9GAMM|nr:cyclic-di-GMP-binding protein [Methylocaldum szegediense]
MQHNPALPFKLDLESASIWLDGLYMANTRECCRVLYPMLKALNASTVEPRLRFAILEKCRTTVSRLDKELLPYFLNKAFPLDAKTRKIASLSSRFFGELATGYRQIAEAESFAEDFDLPDQMRVVASAFEYFANSLLRSAQIFEAQAPMFWSFVFGLFRRAEEQGLCHSAQPDQASDADFVAQYFKVAVLFWMAAPGRLSQQDMQWLFDFLTARAELVRIEATPVSGGTRAVFYFDPAVGGSIMPVPARASVDKPGLRFLFMERLLNEFRAEIRAHGKPEESPLNVVLARLGDRLPHQPEMTARRALASVGMEASTQAVGRVALRAASDSSRVLWSNLDLLELAPPNSDLGSEGFGSKSTGTFAAALASGSGATVESFAIGFSDMRAAKVYRSDLPGFYIVDLGGRFFRTGDLLSLNTDDEIVQVGIVRAGQIYNGQFCYNVELFGNHPRVVRFSSDSSANRLHKGLMFETDSDWPATLVVPRVKLRCGDNILVEEQGVKKTLRVAKLMEANSNFCHIALTAAEASA